MNRVLHDTLSLVEHQFKTARISVETELEAELPRIQGNEGKLQQVVLNLLLNARDAMHGPSGGRIRIATRQTGGQVTVTVEDFGEGIEPEHLHRIFDPFFTTKAEPGKGQHKGTGLGLAVSYGIMQEHGGKMQVESKVGVGATFRLEFPAAAGADRMVGKGGRRAWMRPQASRGVRSMRRLASRYEAGAGNAAGVPCRGLRVHV